MADPIAEYREQRNELLKDIDPSLVRKAWFTMSHLLLEDGAQIADMGSGEGTLTYVMAVLQPHLNFVGVEKDKRLLNKARQKYQLDNLTFKNADVTDSSFDDESLDAIINSYVLHSVYSNKRYNERIISQTLETHFDMLKKGGTMFIRDLSRPPPEEFVMIELPDEPSQSGGLLKMSEADLLIWYSEHARPRQDAGLGGFFLEEMPRRLPKTRLFRLPYKWAYEFIMRKDDRDIWEKELPIEYTFFTPRQFRRELRGLGARVNYSGPQWDQDYIAEHFERKFRLFDDNGDLLGYPPTSYIAVATKMAERKSLHILERRPAPTEESTLKVYAVRNENTGEICDLVKRDTPVSEIIPYRISKAGRLKIYLHDGFVRSLSNSVPRNGVNIDARRWSGHMIEPIIIDAGLVPSPDEIDVKSSVLFARDHLGLKPETDSALEIGPDYYPCPDFIDERIITYYQRVKAKTGAIRPKSVLANTDRFLAKGHIREFDAQQVLNAISVGMIANARLELQILSLFNAVDIQPETWLTKEIIFNAGTVKQKTHLKTLLDKYGANKTLYKDVRGTAGQLRPIHSIFVEEGQIRNSMTGLTSDEIDFVVHETETVNMAVVLPLASGPQNDVHAGFNITHFPVPARHEGNGMSIAAPSFNIPADVVNLRMIKQFVADKFGVLPEMVIKLGESYFSHIGVTPQRIHPFAIIVPPNKPGPPDTHFLPFYQLMLLRASLSKSPHFMILLTRAYKYFHQEIQLDFKKKVKAIVQQRFEQARPKWSLPLIYDTPLKTDKKIVQEIKQEQERKQEIQHKKEAAQNEAENQKTQTLKKSPYLEAAKNRAPLTQDFEQELSDFLDIIEKTQEAKPSPEKW